MRCTKIVIIKDDEKASARLCQLISVMQQKLWRRDTQRRRCNYVTSKKRRTACSDYEERILTARKIEGERETETECVAEYRYRLK